MTVTENRTTLRQLMEFLRQFPEDSFVECCMLNGDVENMDVKLDPGFPQNCTAYGSTRNISVSDLRHNPWIKAQEDKRIWIRFGCRS